MAARKNISLDSGFNPCLLLLVVIATVTGYYFCVLPFISVLFNN
jgi:hypothetical protein